MNFLRALKLRKKKLTRLIVIFLIIGLVYILYRIIAKNNTFYAPLTRGVHLINKYKYLPDVNGMFTCLKNYQVIRYECVNDDYCDCDDGTDEPGTSACPNGVFYCTSLAHSRSNPITSSKVNDGICDCCDGSDEWNSVSLFRTLNSCNPYVH